MELKKGQSEIGLYIADKMNKRLKEIGLSKNRFVDQFEYGNRPTLWRIFKGYNSSIVTVQRYLNAMGLELKVVPKEYE